MKRKYIFLISTICCALLLATLNISFFMSCQNSAKVQTSAAGFSFDRSSDNPFYADYELAGEWEFYPDKLIFSENPDGKVP